ncbi:putative tRNA pseudouridine synthase Pus10 [Blattella germanica]|nr:putative tRNA pseudouridine synthase Pus10 [Blattella germanica]
MAATDLIIERREVYENLRSLGCCKRCCLRYLGERDPTSYKNIERSVVEKGLEDEKGDNEQPEPKLLKTNACIACLGLLQEETSEANTVQKIIEDVLKASYDCDIFTCALSLPISFQLRAQSLWFYIADKFPVPFASQDLHQEIHVISVKEAWKWTIAPLIAKAINKELDSGVNSDFFVGINVTYSEDDDECSCLMEMHAETFKHRKTQKRKYHGSLYTRKAVDAALQSTEAGHFKKYFPSPPSVPTSAAICDSINCSHNSTFIAGRYNKFSRSLSQTPWLIDGERKMESSVQDVICGILQSASKSDGVKFSASGREDVDVRTLGRGRPFVCELLNPHRVKFTLEQVRNLETAINKSNNEVAVRDLQFVNKSELTHLKAGEEKKMKRYTALCICHSPLDVGVLEQLTNIKDITLSQKTPIRVLHRRPLATRPRVVHSMRAWLLKDPSKLCNKESVTLFKLDITTQAGTYIKEFVHGDFGRTQPSLGQLLGGVSVDILALDVEGIELDWPPAVNYDLK